MTRPSRPPDHPSPGDRTVTCHSSTSDVSPRTSRCGWCGAALTDVRARYCKHACRQRAYRARQCHTASARADLPLRIAYADPPYPGLAHYYADQTNYAGEVDHRELLERLVAFDGWALSTSSAALREVLPLCPPGVRVGAWVKPIAPSPLTYGLHSRWEPIIVSPARRLQPGMRDWLAAAPARLGGSDLIGRKPLAFALWLFQALGAVAGDHLEDLFPGSGMIGRAWDHASRAAVGDTFAGAG